MKAGVALNPHTAVDLLEPIINEIDLVCLMSVNPGFGGQSFIESTFEKVKAKRNHQEVKRIDPDRNRWWCYLPECQATD